MTWKEGERVGTKLLFLNKQTTKIGFKQNHAFKLACILINLPFLCVCDLPKIIQFSETNEKNQQK